LFLAGQARLLHARGTREILRSAVWFPPFFTSAFAALAAWFLARRVNLATGVVAGLGLALSPGLVSVSRLGTIDHHFLEPALVVGMASAVLFSHASSEGLLLVAGLPRLGAGVRHFGGVSSVSILPPPLSRPRASRQPVAGHQPRHADLGVRARRVMRMWFILLAA